ncbi:hypothetical protein B0H63DRAFT_422217 [Podospora didyma]|uniref:VWFA domain-containing protein n=1 Tax=Podospora didyma TaxID=330526 RepID=A0AAE0K6A8_9PEZI|nr:hypothetical protein B0H63DRAFT_422217 [Podospora didyma]
MHLSTYTSTYLSIIALVFTDVCAGSTVVSRQSSSDCAPLFGQIDAGNGDRKIGIVIDASGSMLDNDPGNLRLQAAKLLTGKLVTAASAKNGQTADQVTIVQFSDTAEVLYPLGDPSGAGSKIDGIPADGGTFIGGGITAAVDELSKAGTGATPGRTGILVLTDGVDDPIDLATDTVAAIDKARQLGIRVSFGFLSVDETQQDPLIQRAIISTGGTFTTVKTAADVDKIAFMALKYGLVGPPHNTGSSIPLLPDLKTAALLVQTGFNRFTYTAQAGESFTLTVTAIDPVSLKATLKGPDNAAITSAVTDPQTQAAVLKHTAPSSGVFILEVASSGAPATGLFEVQLGSSLDPCKKDSSPVSETTSTITISSTTAAPSTSVPTTSTLPVPPSTSASTSASSVITTVTSRSSGVLQPLETSTTLTTSTTRPFIISATSMTENTTSVVVATSTRSVVQYTGAAAPLQWSIHHVNLGLCGGLAILFGFL